MTTVLNSSLFEFFEFWIWTNHNSLLSIATNQLASFFIDTRLRQCYFRVCQSGEIWNKRAFFLCILIFLSYKTNRFHVAVRLFSNRSQRTSKCGKNISDTLGCASCATFLFLPHFDIICDLLLNRRTATWNLFVNLTTGVRFCFKRGQKYPPSTFSTPWILAKLPVTKSTDPSSHLICML